MLILGQEKNIIVNLDMVHTVSVYRISENQYRILCWTGHGPDDCTGIGDYKTEERGKEIIREIYERYGSYMHRAGSPAVLRGTQDISELFFNHPKLYEMPEE